MFSRVMSETFFKSVEAGSGGRVRFSKFKVLDAIIISWRREESDQVLVHKEKLASNGQSQICTIVFLKKQLTLLEESPLDCSTPVTQEGLPPLMPLLGLVTEAEQGRPRPLQRHTLTGRSVPSTTHIKRCCYLRLLL